MSLHCDSLYFERVYFMSKKTKKITSIGGSALIEGIMMRGPKKSTVCVRTAPDEIYSEDISINTIPSKFKIFKIPFLRGIAGLIDSMRLSYKSLMLSADKAIESAEIEEEPSKFEKWLDDKFGDKLVKVLMVIASVIGVAFAIGLFFFLPSFLFDLCSNFIPAFSVEGDRESTDARRGEGVYDRVVAAMRLMRDNGLPFGVSCCYTSENFEAVSSDAYVNQLIDWGALFVWYFHYMPVGSDANEHLMVSPEQRESMYRTIRRWRTTKPIFPMDFQNDGQYVQGCVAGGRRYLHINAAGDVDPCVFIHFSDSNIHEKTLLECLTSPLFMAYHDGQPFNGNHLMPCPMLENPQELRRIIAETGARSSNLEGEETVEMLCSRCDAYAERWAHTAERLWEADHSCAPFSR